MKTPGSWLAAVFVFGTFLAASGVLAQNRYDPAKSGPKLQRAGASLTKFASPMGSTRLRLGIVNADGALITATDQWGQMVVAGPNGSPQRAS
jgi:hypothetical protein